jgi:hypothetical protein
MTPSDHRPPRRPGHREARLHSLQAIAYEARSHPWRRSKMRASGGPSGLRHVRVLSARHAHRGRARHARAARAAGVLASAGRPVAGVEIGSRRAADGVGEILIKSPTVTAVTGMTRSAPPSAGRLVHSGDVRHDRQRGTPPRSRPEGGPLKRGAALSSASDRGGSERSSRGEGGPRRAAPGSETFIAAVSARGLSRPEGTAPPREGSFSISPPRGWTPRAARTRSRCSPATCRAACRGRS